MEINRFEAPSASNRFRELFRELSRPASTRFVVLTIGLAWIFWFVMWRADYRNFFLICNHDPGAALRTDEIVAAGKRPGSDFFYYYGLLPILVCRAFFSIVGRSPATLLGLIAGLGALFSAGLTSIVLAFRPTRLGVILVAVALCHAITPGIPTHALEAALLIWAVTLRVRGHNAAALVLAVVAVFVKISMGTVLVAELAGLTALDAFRARSARPLLPLLAIPLTAAGCAALCGGLLGRAALAASFDPRGGAAVYAAYDLGFFREGRNFWYPAGHTIGWYLGGLAGPWIVATVVLSVLASCSVWRLLGAGLAASPRTAAATTDEVYATMGFANLAFVVAFFAPSSACVYYYTWILLVGVTPLLARAHLGDRNDEARLVSRLWLVATFALIVSSTGVIRAFASFVREPRVGLGGLSLPPDEAAEWTETISLARVVGHGSVTAVARVANFDFAAPSLRQGGYWMMLKGMRKTRSLEELLGLVHDSDTVFVTKHDYDQIVDIPEFHAFLTKSERLHEGKYFLLLQPARDVTGAR